VCTRWDCFPSIGLLESAAKRHTLARLAAIRNGLHTLCDGLADDVGERTRRMRSQVRWGGRFHDDL
jgi:hypothetical protein